MLEITNTLPMARNLTKPLFQDPTGAGRVIGVFIRFGWVWIGSIMTLLVAIPIIILYICFVVFPPTCVFLIVTNLIGIANG